MTNLKLTELTINTDGGSRGNPGPAGIGFIIRDSNNQIIFEYGEAIGKATNNVAEYTAVIKALEHVVSNYPKVNKIHFLLDSQLVVRQLIGQYKIKNSTLFHLAQTINHHCAQNNINADFSYIPRAQNHEPDALLNQALDSAKD